MLKLTYASNEVPKVLEGNSRVVKVNLPDNWESYKSGNGEGMWGYIRYDKDIYKYTHKAKAHSR